MNGICDDNRMQRDETFESIKKMEANIFTLNGTHWDNNNPLVHCALQKFKIACSDARMVAIVRGVH